MRRTLTAILLVGVAFICTVPLTRAQEPQHGPSHVEPVPDDDRMQDDQMEHDQAMHGRMKHDSMEMRGMLGPYPMSREASGTSWQPNSTPMTGWHGSFGDWMTMFHGFVNAVYTDQQGPRGDEDAFVSSMFMAMGQRRAGDGTLGARAMLSLDPLTIGDRGYPLLFQTGETADGETPLIDRQHPHDLFMELAASWSLPIGQSSVFVYGGLPGEPALGPPTFMHRFSGIDNPEAPLLHHWLDSTHITFGVATLGYVNRGFKLEASAFNGREPDEDRYDIETRGFDSWSARVSYNFGSAWAAQASYGELDSPEQLEPGTDVDRTSLSLIHNRPLAGGNWQTTLAWGLNETQPGEATDGYLLETAAAWGGRHTLFGRIETVEKHELFQEGEPLADQVFRVEKLSIGYIRDIELGQDLRLGFVAMVSQHFIDDTLATVYGDDPTSFLLIVRLKLY